MEVKDADFKEQKFRRDCIARGRLLTGRQMQVLRECLNDVIVEDRGSAVVGNLRISSVTILALLRVCAIKEDSFGYYTITEIGREILSPRTTPHEPTQHKEGK